MIQEKEVELLQDGFRFALSLTHNHSDAEDIVQECWIALYEKKGAIENRALLFTAIRNKFIDMYRKRKREKGTLPEEIHDHNSGEALVLDTIALRRVHEAMSELKPKEREALYLQCVEQYTASEISEVTGSPRGTILSLISRAREKLKLLLGLEKEQTELLRFERRAK